MYIYIYYIIHIYACVNMCDLAHWEVHWRIDCRGVGVNWRPVDLSIAVPPNVSLKLLHQAAPGRLHHLCQIHRHIFASPIVCTVYIYIYIYIWLYIFYYIYLYIYLSLSLSLYHCLIGWLVHCDSLIAEALVWIGDPSLSSTVTPQSVGFINTPWLKYMMLCHTYIYI